VKTTLCLLFGLALAAPAAAQDEPKFSIRPFVFGSVEQFAAVDAFDAVFGRTYEPFFGGGVQVVVREKYFVELTASRFKQTGQRAFINAGQKFRLGIPLTATLTPLEATAGYRYRVSPTLLAYGSAGVGTYHYTEASDFDQPGEGVDKSHVGFVANGGVEYRLHRWVGVAGDVQYTHVPGILGDSGTVSGQANENDLGGLSVRLKVIVGR
jgi:opacity protein-like surface antigen